MALTMKQAADELLKIADEIEKEAADVTQFVCDKCNHTASLSSINTKRKEAGKTAGENVTVSEITVNDKIQCPACDGVMAYKETEASAPYYYDPDKNAAEPTPAEVAEEAKETPKEQAKEEKGEELHAEPHTASEPIDYDSLKRYTA